MSLPQRENVNTKRDDKQYDDIKIDAKQYDDNYRFCGSLF